MGDPQAGGRRPQSWRLDPPVVRIHVCYRYGAYVVYNVIWQKRHCSWADHDAPGPAGAKNAPLEPGAPPQ